MIRCGNALIPRSGLMMQSGVYVLGFLHWGFDRQSQMVRQCLASPKSASPNPLPLTTYSTSASKNTTCVRYIEWLLRNFLRPLVTPKRSHGKRYPTENKTKSTYWRNCPQPASSAECHQVKATGKYEYSNQKQPTRRIDQITWPTSRCPGNGEQRQRMVHMITNADFKNG